MRRPPRLHESSVSPGPQGARAEGRAPGPAGSAVPSALGLLSILLPRGRGSLVPRSGSGGGGDRGSPHPPVAEGPTRTPRGGGELRPGKHFPAHQRVPEGPAQPPRSRWAPCGFSLGATLREVADFCRERARRRRRRRRRR